MLDEGFEKCSITDSKYTEQKNRNVLYKLTRYKNLLGRDIRPNALKAHELGKPNLREEKSTTTKVQCQMHPRHVS